MLDTDFEKLSREHQERMVREASDVEPKLPPGMIVQCDGDSCRLVPAKPMCCAACAAPMGGGRLLPEGEHNVYCCENCITGKTRRTEKPQYVLDMEKQLDDQFFASTRAPRPEELEEDEMEERRAKGLPLIPKEPSEKESP